MRLRTKRAEKVLGGSKGQLKSRRNRASRIANAALRSLSHVHSVKPFLPSFVFRCDHNMQQLAVACSGRLLSAGEFEGNVMGQNNPEIDMTYSHET